VSEANELLRALNQPSNAGPPHENSSACGLGLAGGVLAVELVVHDA
jgi:hypothetical protein